MSKYTNLLKDPRWQKKRLEIMSRDQFKCTKCEDETEMLVVHHKYYDKARMPWEYPDKSLLTLCSSCHSQYHKDEREIIEGIIDNFKRSDFSLTDIWSLSNYMKRIDFIQPDERFISALKVILDDKENQQLIMDYFDGLPLSTKIELSLITQS